MSQLAKVEPQRFQRVTPPHNLVESNMTELGTMGVRGSITSWTARTMRNAFTIAVLCLPGVLPVAAASEPGEACAGSPIVSGRCESVQGTLHVWNGWPP